MMAKGIEKINIADIDFSLDYEGYLWYSNRQSPIIFPKGGEVFSGDCFSELPFIIEGNLYAKAENISLRIKYLNGDYQITRFKLNETAEHYEYDPKGQTYMGHDIQPHKKFKMLEAWEAVENHDTLPKGMKTLQPAWTAFIGFA